MVNSSTKDVPKLYALWLMPLPLIIHVAGQLLDADGEIFNRWIESESGFIENGTVLLLIPAAIFMLIAAKRFWQASTSVDDETSAVVATKASGKLVAIWMLLGALVCIGFAGEEASWGQHWLGWQSPEYFAENNRQGETNFHNIDLQLGRIVKSILTIAIIIGGLIIPLRRKKHSSAVPRKFIDYVSGTTVCVPAAFFVLIVRLVERFKTWFDLDWVILAVNLKELQELYIAIFLVIYAWSIKLRTDLTK